MSEKDLNIIKQPVNHNLSKSALQSEYVRSYAMLYGYDLQLNEDINVVVSKSYSYEPTVKTNIINTKDNLEIVEKVKDKEIIANKNTLKSIASIFGMVFSALSYIICLFAFVVIGLNGFKEVTTSYYDIFGKLSFIDKSNVFLILTCAIIGVLLLLNVIYFIKSAKALNSVKVYKLVFLKTLTIIFSVLLFIFVYAISMLEKIKYDAIIQSSQKMALIVFVNMITVIVGSYFTFLYSFSVNSKRTLSKASSK